MHVDGFSELVARPARGRVFTEQVRPGFADSAPSGRVRLDALARWLQDVAYADVEDAGLAQSAVWVVRRTRMRVNRFPRFGEHFAISTFCSGLGRMWAERRTTVSRAGKSAAYAGGADAGGADTAGAGAGAADARGADAGGADAGGADAAGAGVDRTDVEAVSLWVHLDPVDWRPVPLSEQEIAVYGDSAAARRVTARLRHPSPESIAQRSTWTFRATDCDIAGHINNAVYWEALEEDLLRADDPERIDVEIEYRTPAQPGDKLVLSNGGRRWIVGGDGEMHASIIVAEGGPDPCLVPTRDG